MTSERNPRDLLEEMEELAFLEERFEDVAEEEFLERRDLQRIAERSLEILGGATKGLPPSVRDGSPSLPWSEMARTRDMMIHAGHRAKPAIVWRTIHDDVVPRQSPRRKIPGEETRGEKDGDPHPDREAEVLSSR